MKRRDFLATTAAALVLQAQGGFAEDAADVSLLETARLLRDQPYVPNTTPLSPPFDDLDYNAFRGIRPIAGQTAMLPHGPKFAVDLLPPGLYFLDPVKIDRVSQDVLTEIAFSPKLFTYEPRYFDTIPDTSPGAGFTGLRLRYPLNAPEQMDELLVMQGASYFRAIGEAMAYGLSARTIALGTGGPTAEEFPRFVHLRLHPADGDAVRIEGVIDSPSLTGHLDLTVYPGRNTEMEVVTTIFPRVEIADIGVAPATSMYLKGPMLSAVSDDFRPRVHDSDVLVIHNGADEHLWRPVANPRGVETSAFADVSPKAFGLYQTARTFESFQDTEARYHDRPSLKVTPQGAWGAGAVMLVELPTGDEFMDNIVAFWRPQDTLVPGQDYRFAYRLTWTLDQPDLGYLPPFVQGRSGREHDQPGFRRYVVDVATTAEKTSLAHSVSEGAEIKGVSVFALPDQDVTRVTFLFSPGDLPAAEIRLSLRASDGTPLSPVWLHRWTPARDGGV